MDGVAFLLEANTDLPRGEARIAYSLRGHECRDRRHQSSQHQLLFLKPWDPPAEHLYPQLDDLLDDWQASYRPAFSGNTVLGTRWSPRSYELRTSWRATVVPYQWIDVEGFRQRPGNQATSGGIGAGGCEPSCRTLPRWDETSREHTGGSRAKGRIADSRANHFLRPCYRGGGPAGLAAAVYGASKVCIQ